MKTKYLLILLIVASCALGFPSFPWGLVGVEQGIIHDLIYGLYNISFKFIFMLLAHMSLFLLLPMQNKSYYPMALLLLPLVFLISVLMHAFILIALTLLWVTFIPFIVLWCILLYRTPRSYWEDQLVG